MPRTAPALALVAAIVSVAVSDRGRADDWRVELDPGRTTVRFTLGATLHDVHGTLELIGGSLSFDPQTGAASGVVTIDATSADTGNAKRDRDMHAKVLESGLYPEIVYSVREVRGELPTDGAAALEIVGEVELHGDRHPLTIAAEITIDDDGVSGSATLTVPYVEWGLKDPSKFVLRVAKTVAVEIEVAGRLMRGDAEEDSLAPGTGEPR